jgi:hypothetical protein
VSRIKYRLSRNLILPTILLTGAFVLFSCAPPDNAAALRDIDSAFTVAFENIFGSEYDSLSYKKGPLDVSGDKASLILSFERAATIRSIQIRWNISRRHSDDVKSSLVIEDVDRNGLIFETIYGRNTGSSDSPGEASNSVTMNTFDFEGTRVKNGNIEIVRPYKPFVSSFLKFTFSTNEFCRNTIDDITILADPPTPIEKALSESAGASRKTVLLEKDDPANPLRLCRKPLSNAIKTAAELILESECSNISDHMDVRRSSDRDKAINLLNYFSSFKFGEATDSTPERTLAEQIGICGSITMAFLALTTAEGIEGRAISLFNSPSGDGHSLAELRIDGKWELYDPTFGACFASDKVSGAGSFEKASADNPDRRKVLSFEELREAALAGERDFKRIILFDNIDPKKESLLGQYFTPEAVATASPAGVIGPEWPMWFELSLDSSRQSEIDTDAIKPGTFQGSSHLGAESTNNNLVLILSSLKRNSLYELLLEPRYISREIAKPFAARAILDSPGKLISGFEYIVPEAQNNPPPWRILFSAGESKARLKLTHDEKGPYFSYISIKKISLLEKEEPD